MIMKTTQTILHPQVVKHLPENQTIRKIFFMRKKAPSNDIMNQENATVSSDFVEEKLLGRKMVSMSLTNIHFQTQVIQ